MDREELSAAIKTKYPDWFHDDFMTREELGKWLALSDEHFVAHEWIEFGATLVEVGDNNMWCCGFVIVD